MEKIKKISLWVLVINLLVIIWGAYVRASGSGAGCGSHWPLCNGEIIPRAAVTETIIEYTHRIMSGFAFLAVIFLTWQIFKTTKKGHVARKTIVWAAFFMLVEAMIGAVLVLFRLTADNTSSARAIVIAIHLINTMFLIGSLALTYWFSFSTGERSRLHSLTNLHILAWALGTFLLLCVGISGAITALGDTLFPASNLLEGIASDFQSSSHILIQLRIFHPAIAAFTSLILIFLSNWIRKQNQTSPEIRRIILCLRGFIGMQLLLGVINIILLAPVWMQLLHLFISNLVWITWITLLAFLIRPFQFLFGIGNK